MTMVDIDDLELGISYQDAGPWRSYHLTAIGGTIEEAIEDASISEIDQDGGELCTYALEDAPEDVYKRSEEVIKRKAGVL